MSTTPQEIWQHAQGLPSTSESEIRAKISRAYYALYSHALAFHESLPTPGNVLKETGGSHKQLHQKLTNPTTIDKSLQVISRDLGTKQNLAHELRVKADYHLNQHVDQKDLTKCLGYVRRGMELSAGQK